MKQTQPAENPMVSLAVNIVAPVLILNKGAHYLNPQVCLALAISFPLVYGIQDYYRRRHKNYVSLMGLVNIMLTGGLAAMNLTGIWFAFKEATLPFVLGLLVFGSAYTANPAARMFFCNPGVLKMDVIEERLKAGQHETAFRKILRTTTLWLSVSFFISAAANFALAFNIFHEIDKALPIDEQHKVLNEQLAHMTWMGFATIALPLMIFSGILIYAFLKRLSKLVDLPIDGLMHS